MAAWEMQSRKQLQPMRAKTKAVRSWEAGPEFWLDAEREGMVTGPLALTGEDPGVTAGGRVFGRGEAERGQPHCLKKHAGAAEWTNADPS